MDYIETFTYKGINVTVNITKAQVSFIKPGHQQLYIVFQTGVYKPNVPSKSITVHNSFKLVENNIQIGNSTPLQVITFTNDDTNSNGIGYFDFFFNLSTGNQSTGEIHVKALINNLFESTEVSNYFGGDKIACFNPYDPTTPWSFFIPVDATVSSTEASADVEAEYVFNTNTSQFDLVSPAVYNNDGSILVNVVSPAGTYEYALYDADENLLVDYTSSNTFSNLAAGQYNVRARNVATFITSPLQSVVVGKAIANTPGSSSNSSQ